MTATLLGPIDWNCNRDDKMHRTYHIDWLIESNDIEDGPQTISFTSGLPAIGAPWTFGNDNDVWAYCMPEWVIKQEGQDQAGTLLWRVSQQFSTKFSTRCATTSIENPLLEPMRISGTFKQQKREEQKDRNGNLLQTSAQELFSGSLIEIDEAHPTVTIEMTTSTNMLSTFTPYMNMVNDATLWGLAKRKVKLSECTWTRKVWGTCTFYYTTTLGFHVHPKTWDRKLQDYGSFCLKEDFWGLDNAGKDARRADPLNLVQYKDRNFENAKCFLDGHGCPLKPGDAPVEIKAEWYEEANLLLLGIPSSL